MFTVKCTTTIVPAIPWVTTPYWIKRRFLEAFPVWQVAIKSTTQTTMAAFSIWIAEIPSKWKCTRVRSILWKRILHTLDCTCCIPIEMMSEIVQLQMQSYVSHSWCYCGRTGCTFKKHYLLSFFHVETSKINPPKRSIDTTITTYNIAVLRSTLILYSPLS